LTHRAGFVPDDPISDYDNGPEAALKKYTHCRRLPSGIEIRIQRRGFIVLGELVRRISGTPLDEFARKISTCAGDARHRIPTKPDHRKANCNRQKSVKMTKTHHQETLDAWRVHDPRSYLLGGVAGHAGLFSTADDLAVFCQMILSAVRWYARIMSPLTVARMTSPRDFGDSNIRDSVGIFKLLFKQPWRPFPARLVRTHRFYRHIDLDHVVTGTFVIFLSNRVHPDGKGMLRRCGTGCDDRCGLDT